MYDDNNNRTSFTKSGTTTTYSYDNQDRLTSDTVYNYVYNANGELTSKTNTLTSGTTTYSYDVFGNLTGAAWPSTTAASRSIDAMGRPSKLVNWSSGERRLIYDAEGRIVGIVSGNTGQISKRFIYGSKKNIPDYYVDYSQGKNFYRIISDYLGSPRLIINLSSNTVSATMEHDPFGMVITDTSPGSIMFGFAGGLLDVNSKTIHFGARDYDASTGRWLTKDPIRFGGGDTNLYGYVMNDPVNLIDPSGLYKVRLTRQNLEQAAAYATGVAAIGMCAGGPKAAAIGGAWAFSSSLAVDIILNNELGFGGDDSSRLVDIDIPTPWDSKKEP